MRYDFLYPANGLTYEIRNIADMAAWLKNEGLVIDYENIGDPVAKGEKVPSWVKEILKQLIDNDITFAYSPTKGVENTRDYIASKTNSRGGAQINKEDIIFFNGVGDAVSCIYSMMGNKGRVILPSPTYSTHYLAEVKHAFLPAFTYNLDPKNNWEPDIAGLERTVQSNMDIVGIMVVNPDNPTGHIYSEKSLREIVRIAEKNDLFLLFDEIYADVTFDESKTVYLSDIIGEVPGLSMKGLSKSIPWTGARSGWIEVYNYGKDTVFDSFVRSIYKHKMEEICSTTLPQYALPLIFEHPEYKSHLKNRVSHYKKLADIALEEFSSNNFINVLPVQGAFYATAVFKDGVLNDSQYLPISSKKIDNYITGKLLGNTNLDKRFVYYLLASSGTCVVPLSSFFTPLNGFRMTLLERDSEKFRSIIKKINKNINKYIDSGR